MSVLQGEIFVSSKTCLGKNTANIWIHQEGVIVQEGAIFTDLLYVHNISIGVMINPEQDQSQLPQHLQTCFWFENKSNLHL